MPRPVQVKPCSGEAKQERSQDRGKAHHCCVMKGVCRNQDLNVVLALMYVELGLCACSPFSHHGYGHSHTGSGCSSGNISCHTKRAHRLYHCYSRHHSNAHTPACHRSEPARHRGAGRRCCSGA